MQEFKKGDTVIVSSKYVGDVNIDCWEVEKGIYLNICDNNEHAVIRTTGFFANHPGSGAVNYYKDDEVLPYDDKKFNELTKERKEYLKRK